MLLIEIKSKDFDILESEKRAVRAPAMLPELAAAERKFAVSCHKLRVVRIGVFNTFVHSVEWLGNVFLSRHVL